MASASITLTLTRNEVYSLIEMLDYWRDSDSNTSDLTVIYHALKEVE